MDSQDFLVPQWIQNLIFMMTTSRTNQNTASGICDLRPMLVFSRWQKTRKSSLWDCSMMRFSTASIHRASGVVKSRQILPMPDSRMGILYTCSSWGQRASQSRYRNMGSISPRASRLIVYFSPKPRKMRMSSTQLKMRPSTRVHWARLLQQSRAQRASRKRADRMRVACMVTGINIIGNYPHINNHPHPPSHSMESVLNSLATILIWKRQTTSNSPISISSKVIKESVLWVSCFLCSISIRQVKRRFLKISTSLLLRVDSCRSLRWWDSVVTLPQKWELGRKLLWLTVNSLCDGLKNRSMYVDPCLPSIVTAPWKYTDFSAIIRWLFSQTTKCMAGSTSILGI